MHVCVSVRFLKCKKICCRSDDVRSPTIDIMKSAITQQSLVRINLNFGAKRQIRFSHSSLKLFGPEANIFGHSLHCKISKRGQGPTIFD